MAKLNVNVISENQVEYSGVVYEKASYPVQVGDIVQANENANDIDYGKFYEVKGIDSDDDFKIIDEDGDKRYRDINDTDFVPYRKVVGSMQQPITITLDQPVHLVIKNIASISFEIEGGR